MSSAWRVVVTGRVQGVGFRVAAMRRADALGLAGWVRNLPDGGVEVVVQGPVPEVDRFLDFLEVGPPGARIGTATRQERAPDPRLRWFEIR